MKNWLTDALRLWLALLGIMMIPRSRLGAADMQSGNNMQHRHSQHACLDTQGSKQERGAHLISRMPINLFKAIARASRFPTAGRGQAHFFRNASILSTSLSHAAQQVANFINIVTIALARASRKESKFAFGEIIAETPAMQMDKKTPPLFQVPSAVGGTDMSRRNACLHEAATQAAACRHKFNFNNPERLPAIPASQKSPDYVSFLLPPFLEQSKYEHLVSFP
jgi:hypothetical protein